MMKASLHNSSYFVLFCFVFFMSIRQGLPNFVRNPETDVVVPSSSDAPVSPTPPASCHGSSRFRPPGGSPSSSSSSSTTTTSFSTFIHPEAGPPDAGTHNHQLDGTWELKEQLEALRCQVGCPVVPRSLNVCFYSLYCDRSLLLSAPLFPREDLWGLCESQACWR